METNKLIAGIVAAAIAVIVLAGVLMPALSNATTTHETFTNEGYINYKFFEQDDTFSFDFTDGVLTVNGETITQPPYTSQWFTYTFVGSEDWLLRYANNNGSPIIQGVGLRKDGGIFNTNVKSGEISGGDFIVTSTGDIEVTLSFDKFYSAVGSPDEAVMKESTSSAYILGDSEIFISGLTQITAWSNMIFISGTYDDGITITSPNLDDVTFDNIEWVIEPVDGYIDLYKLTAIKFDATYNGNVTHCTYNYFDVPSSVTAERSVHLSDAMNVILNVIPLLIIVAVLLGVVAVFILRRE